MTKIRKPDLERVASFVIERRAGKGYQVTAASGPRRAGEGKTRALALLDDLGQPDPAGPPLSFRCVGPIAPTGDCVAAATEMLPNGEVRVHEEWFRPPQRSGLPRIPIVLAIVTIGVIFGILADRKLPLLASQTAADTNAKSAAKTNDRNATNLAEQLAASADLRKQLTEFLSQPGLAADLSRPVRDLRPAIVSLGVTSTPAANPPRIPGMWLSNVNVARLLALLDCLAQRSAGAELRPAPPIDH